MFPIQNSKRNNIFLENGGFDIDSTVIECTVHLYVRVQPQGCRDCMVVGFTNTYVIRAYHH